MQIVDRRSAKIKDLKGKERALELISRYMGRYKCFYIGVTQFDSQSKADIENAIKMRLANETELDRKYPDKVIVISAGKSCDIKDTETACIKRFKSEYPDGCLNKLEASGISPESPQRYILYLRLFK